jgi:uncharacterized protein YjiS (DUF1127 family)
MGTLGLTGGITAAFGNWLQNLRREVEDERQRRRIYAATFQELASLSDRDLTDIGISRLQIGDIAQDAAYGRHTA